MSLTRGSHQIWHVVQQIETKTAPGKNDAKGPHIEMVQRAHTSMSTIASSPLNNDQRISAMHASTTAPAYSANDSSAAQGRKDSFRKRGSRRRRGREELTDLVEEHSVFALDPSLLEIDLPKDETPLPSRVRGNRVGPHFHTHTLLHTHTRTLSRNIRISIFNMQMCLLRDIHTLILIISHFLVRSLSGALYHARTLSLTFCVSLSVSWSTNPGIRPAECQARSASRLIGKCARFTASSPLLRATLQRHMCGNSGWQKRAYVWTCHQLASVYETSVCRVQRCQERAMLCMHSHDGPTLPRV